MTARAGIGSVRPWAAHALCLALLLGQAALWWSSHRSFAELDRVVRDGSTQQKLDALHVLANRGEPHRERFGEKLVRALLAQEDDRLKEVAFHVDICRFHEPVLQNTYVQRGSLTDYPHWWRAYVLHHRKRGGSALGGSRRFTRQELEWYFEALNDRVPPLDQVEAHLRAISDTARRRQTALGIGSGEGR